MAADPEDLERNFRVNTATLLSMTLEFAPAMVTCGSDAIAEEVFYVAHQDRSTWSFDVELRPFGDKW